MLWCSHSLAASARCLLTLGTSTSILSLNSLGVGYNLFLITLESSCSNPISVQEGKLDQKCCQQYLNSFITFYKFSTAFLSLSSTKMLTSNCLLRQQISRIGWKRARNVLAFLYELSITSSTRLSIVLKNSWSLIHVSGFNARFFSSGSSHLSPTTSSHSSSASAYYLSSLCYDHLMKHQICLRPSLKSDNICCLNSLASGSSLIQKLWMLGSVFL